MITELNIPQINDEQNFWMMRTKRGVFYNEYISDKFIAIGWNFLTQDRIFKLTKKSNEEFKKSIEEIYGERRPQTAINKCVRFITELKENDIVAIIGSSKVAFANIGKYYEIHEDFEIEQEIETNKEIEKNSHSAVECPYSKRRTITIIKEIDISQLSPYLLNTITANHHSLSSLNDNSNLILSACYDLFFRGDKLVCTFRVQQEKDIDSYDYASFLFNISSVLRKANSETKTVIKTNVHSAGDIIFELLNGVKDCLPFILLIWIACFGGKINDIEFPSLFNVVKYFIELKDTKKSKELDQRIKSAEAESQELDNLKKKIELAKENYEQIAQAAQALNIKKIDSTIIDISQYLNSGDISDDKK